MGWAARANPTAVTAKTGKLPSVPKSPRHQRCTCGRWVLMRFVKDEVENLVCMFCVTVGQLGG